MLFKYSMSLFNLAVLLVVLGVEANTDENENAPANEIFDNYPDNAKRSHNIMRFGKRMIDDELDQKRNHNMIHFGKRAFSIPGDNRFPELLRILRSDDRDWWKRGHNIMRFGKRADDHHFIHFGKRDDEDATSNEYYDNVDDGDDHTMLKRPQHALIRFGKRFLFPRPSKSEESPNMGNKRFPHTMIHFGKRDYEDQEYSSNYSNDNEDILDSGEDLLPMNSEKRAHSMIHFGKKDEPYELDEKRSHQLMHFGKRYDGDEEKRDHKLIHFGKRFELEDDKRAHQLIHFGKRLDDEEEEKRSHSLMHFGKRLNDEEEEKRSHSLMHFGKRLNDEDEKRSHSLMHFGKRFNTEFDKRVHSMIHFGKRMDGDMDKRGDYKLLFYPKKEDNHHHNIMHFGKRNAESINDEINQGPQGETSRTKRSSKKEDISKNKVTTNTSSIDTPFNKSQSKKND
ncbi:FMRF-amide neuropeptides-like [Centruroides vittatus]|uniref:FMRF-amide neuropeptides-like n=1 Tax=Centruroides vittatus TaxID=120091 RepID=UPI00350E955A